MTAVDTLDKIQVSDSSTGKIDELKAKCYEALNDDLNTPILIAHLFDGVRMINSLAAGTEFITAEDLENLKALYNTLVFDVLGLQKEGAADGGNNELLDKVIAFLLETRNEAKKNKDWATADKIRDELTNLGIVVKDTKDGFEWEITK
jgi:cysteinyl-tRNA synthetase